ncbi:uncharacterized protein [Miscanthus floridulus]|uniref:uncharacterized protein n=1 Tax=Miscanthus floridulus TaxID=154761 RepID=UPI00345790FD
MEATVPMTTETAVAAVGVSTSAEATMAEAGAPETAETVVVEAGAPEVTEAVVMAARPSVQEVEMQAAEASAVPLAQGPPLLRESAWETEELEEELTRAVSDRDAFRSWAKEAMASGKALARQLGAEEKLGSEASRAAETSRVEAQQLREKVEACQVETRRWELKAKESEAEFTRAAEASSTVQIVLDTEIKEHEALKRAALSACEALEVEGV